MLQVKLTNLWKTQQDEYDILNILQPYSNSGLFQIWDRNVYHVCSNRNLGRQNRRCQLCFTASVACCGAREPSVHPHGWPEAAKAFSNGIQVQQYIRVLRILGIRARLYIRTNRTSNTWTLCGWFVIWCDMYHCRSQWDWPFGTLFARLCSVLWVTASFPRNEGRVKARRQGWQPHWRAKRFSSTAARSIQKTTFHNISGKIETKWTTLRQKQHINNI